MGYAVYDTERATKIRVIVRVMNIRPLDGWVLLYKGAALGESPNSDVCQIKYPSARWLRGIDFLHHKIDIIRLVVEDHYYDTRI